MCPDSLTFGCVCETIYAGWEFDRDSLGLYVQSEDDMASEYDANRELALTLVKDDESHGLDEWCSFNARKEGEPAVIDIDETRWMLFHFDA